MAGDLSRRDCHVRTEHHFAPADIAEAYEIALQSSQLMRELTVTALGNFDIRNQIHQIAAPTLIIVGEQDQTCPVDMSETIHTSIGGSRRQLIPDCAHLVPVEQPQTFCEKGLTFLSGVDRGTHV